MIILILLGWLYFKVKLFYFTLQRLQAYFKNFHFFPGQSVAFEMYTSIAILRSPNGFDFTNYLCQESSAKYSIDLSQSKPIANGNLYELNRSTHSGEVENRGFEPDFDVSSPLPPLFQQIDLNGNCSVSTFPAESNAVVVDVDTDDDVFVDSKNNSTDVKCVSSNRDPVQWSAFALFQPDTAKTPDSIVNELKRFSTEQPKGKIDGNFKRCSNCHNVFIIINYSYVVNS